MPGWAGEESTFLAEIIGSRFGTRWNGFNRSSHGRALGHGQSPASDADITPVRAECACQRLGPDLERQISLEQTPILEWRWRVDSIYEGIDETEKSGDDYPARIYIVAERWPRFRSRIVNYVWSSSQPQGATWVQRVFVAIPHGSRARSGESRLGEWITERRDVLADFRRYHGMSPIPSTPWRIMTDCDNAGQQATAWYGPIRWASRRTQQ